MDASDFCLLQHARLHTPDVATVEGGSLVEQCLTGLSEAHLRTRPAPGVNSIAWLLWHMARSEDVYVNALLMKRGQVFDKGDWAARLRVPRRDTGAGMASADVTALSEAIDLPTLHAYRSDVGKATRAIVRSLTSSWWIEPVTEIDVERVLAAGAFVSSVVPAVRRFTQRTRGGVLGGLAIVHNAGHLGEAQTVRSLLNVS